MVVGNECLRIALSRRPRCGLTALVDRRTGRNFVHDPSAPLYRLLLSRQGEKPVPLSSRDAKKVVSRGWQEEGRRGATFEFRGHASLDITVTCTVSLEPGSALARWKLAVRNRSRFGIRCIEYPVVMDNESMIWSSYGNRAWPTKIIIDKEGFVRCAVSGEGNYGAMEKSIHSLLDNAGVKDELPMIMDPVRESDRMGVMSFKATPELFAGYLRGSVGNIEGYSPESVVEYADPNIYFDGRFYLEGRWLNDRNSLRHQEVEESEGQIIVSYQGLEVNAVINTEDGKQFEMMIRQDDQFLSSENKGDDVLIEADGRSVLRIVEPKMYGIIRNRDFGEHVLRLSTRSNTCGLYSFTFVSSVIPEMISNN